MSTYPLLETIDAPAQLRELDRRQLPQLAEELRAFLVESVSRTGGHLSSNLGTVELTIALHYVFNTPDDRIVWDVGHQTYSHKILTGRRNRMTTLRQYDGISGFPRRCESEYDTFGTAHSSTSISAALGMAVAARQRGLDRHAVAVIGDGAMSAGMAFEALNNAGVTDAPLLVVLNDNEMSISPPVGALTKILARMLSGRTYAAARRASAKVLGSSITRRVEEHVKGLVTPGTLFEEFGFNYIGPIDGHDLDALIPTLQNIRNLQGPQFLHVITRKGQGYKLAEANPTLYHGVGKFDQAAGIQTGKGSGKLTFTQVFSDWICDAAVRDPRLVAITPAMREGSGLVRFEQEHPDRYFDVGIAEQHALTFAAGLACEGQKPVVAIYSTFLQRAYDQLIHDIALQNLPVMLAVDRGGLVGADGATHHGVFDLSYLLCIPNMVVMTPSDERECQLMLNTAFSLDCPTAVRYPRGGGAGNLPEAGSQEVLPVGKGRVIREGKGPAILAFGSLLHEALQAADTLDAAVVDMRFAKPLDVELIEILADRHQLLVTLEENATISGAGSEVARLLESRARPPALLRLGLPDHFIDHGDQAQLLRDVKLDAQGIQRRIQAHPAYIVNS
ncbi:MAG: 1-deoxy-D-xylulose-5-phosphate synthase [Candidatus Dactylopiibacterium carminicum]|uniref:1-deoxy-D-xylulose-5-phosphate synthase n=1 Tax=Candidatus Dactylopiibacterium carminicum TaxID=857335 RepID=A0A272EPK6_9RHOO|nr:1-deoxy-D-xylulose-5-phosphate synthase [Candidatus Dactylopiibacterium carminicum]KAF7598314.1 1-deoxy-D-xylulose-5-phosphate synthase [Candidatus Dactylopiibacterium carminicum]PAS92018.1 MAG: 1-deoxy-D-xylulose-5-phosphate synthase [Candidatus Dactylopiibacterium carminicum]PAS97311.1 MAG: 1-deoxy-D-xylulose-5-phosphate synthase [Candidatus Dactylopiibacterium carminicum]